MNDNADRPGQKYTHGEMIRILLEPYLPSLPANPLFVETGCGISTLWLAEVGRTANARVISCDFNVEKVDALKAKAGERVANVEFRAGDSMQLLEQIGQQHDHIHFLFLDAAASAMHTFRELQVIEHVLGNGSILLIDNAALPGETRLLSPCRKGKIIVPYLQASAHWQVSGHPAAGDSMVSAVYHDNPDYADPAYEWPEYNDPWEWSFQNHWVE